MTSTVILRAIGLAAGLALAGCDATEPASEIPPQVLAFLASEALPQSQEPRVAFRDGPSRILLFAVTYGPPQDCRAGCFYASAAGLQIGERVGWWGGAVAARPGFQPLDVQASDTVLFDLAFLRRFKSAHPWLYDHFGHFLACDPDTPSAVRDHLRDETSERPFPHCPAIF